MTSTAPKSLAVLAAASAALLGLLVAALCAALWPAWRHDPDLAHGIFMPIAFLLLLRESRRRGARRFLAPGWGSAAAIVALGLAGLAALAAAGLIASGLGWSHAAVGFLLAAAAAFLLLAAFVGFADRRLRWLPLNWSSVVAAFLWLLACPLPPGTYSRIAVALQLDLTQATVGLLHACGIAAERQGNIIELARTTVGVTEACSGVRSLVACLFTGVFLSGCLVRRPWARILIVALAPLLALATNLLRSFAITLLANANPDTAKHWHDPAGFAVLGLTAVLLCAAALRLERGAPEPAPAAPAAPEPGRLGGQILLAAALGAAAALACFFASHRQPPAEGTAPDLLALLPPAPPGWSALPAQDLTPFRSSLRTDLLAERTYVRRGAGGLEQITLYLAYWRPDQAPVSAVAAHTPDACWPGAGWEARPAPATARLAIGDRALPEAQARLFVSDSDVEHVWFWHLYGGRPLMFEDPYSIVALLRIAGRYAYRPEREQFVVRVSSNRSWPALAADPILEAFFARLRPFGL